MIGSPARGVGILLCLVAAVGAPRPSEAQFKKLKQAVTGKAAEEVLQTSACVPATKPTVVASIPLSAAQIRAINAGLDAELAAAPNAEKDQAEAQKKLDADMKAYEKARADYDKAYEKWSKCRDNVAEADNKTSEGLRAKNEQAGDNLAAGIDTAKMMALAEKAQAASQRISEGKGTAEDRKTLAEFQAMMMPISANAAAAGAAMQEASAFDQGAQARIEKACGKEPQEPKPPGNNSGMAEDVIQGAGAKAAKMPIEDYRAARELVLGYAMSNTVVGGGGGGGGGGGADAQNQALKETAEKICALKKARIPV